MHVSIGRRKPAAIIAAVATATVLMAALTPAAQAEPDSASENTETIALVEELIPATEQVELAPATQIGDELLVEGGDVTISSDASEGTEFALPKGLEMTIAPIAEAGAQEGEIVAGQAVTEISEEITVVTRPIEDGARMISVLETPAADTAVDYRLELPTGAEAVLSEEGAVDIWHVQEQSTLVTRTLLARIDAPWAVDANGQSVETSFVLGEGILTQVVTPTADTAFPVIADPATRRISCGTVSVGAGMQFVKLKSGPKLQIKASYQNCDGYMTHIFSNVWGFAPGNDSVSKYPVQPPPIDGSPGFGRVYKIGPNSSGMVSDYMTCFPMVPLHATTVGTKTDGRQLLAAGWPNGGTAVSACK